MKKPVRIYTFKELEVIVEEVTPMDRECPYYTLDGYKIQCHEDFCEYEFKGSCRIEKTPYNFERIAENDYHRRDD